MIWVNFKTYQQTFGDKALFLAEVCQKVSKQTNVKIIPVCSALNLREIKQKIGGEVWLQHLDPVFEGKHTGWLSPIAAIAAGADGALVSHSEHELAPGKIAQLLSHLKKDRWLKEWGNKFSDADNLVEKIKKFRIMVCFKTKGQALWVKRLKPRPDFVAYEPSDLIGTKVSVAEAKADVVTRVRQLLPDNDLIIGAGINKAADVKKSIKLGAKGVLVSSDIVCATDPKKELLDLSAGFK